MKVLLINEVCGTGSHGRICADLAKEFEYAGNEVKIAYGRDFNVPIEARKYAVPIGNKLNVYWHVLYTRLTDKHGLASKLATKRFLKWAKDYNPDLLWLHNIHGYYINYEMLFAWIKSRPDMQVKWTLHDCWAFTGHCAYFSFAECEKWKDGTCSSCPERKQYPASSFLDNSTENFQRKKAAFTGAQNMTLISPSNWLANLLKESFLREYPVEVINNTVDTNVFRPTDSVFKGKYGIENKKIVLGVSNAWQEPRKGLKDFYVLAKMLPEDYVVVLVGLSEEQIISLPKNIIGLTRTNNQQELAEIYSCADVLFNPTYEDNYPTVNLEAEACGTRVITYASGGSPETLKRQQSTAVKAGDIEATYRLIIKPTL